MMHLQGDLQTVFDALYDLGVIEPILQKDWKPTLLEIENGSIKLERAVGVVNRFATDRKILVIELQKLDRRCLEVLAVEVAREFAEFHARQAVLH